MGQPSVPGGLRRLFRRMAASFLGGTGMSTSLPLVTSSNTSQLGPRRGAGGVSVSLWGEARMMLSSTVDPSVPAAGAGSLSTDVSVPSVLRILASARHLCLGGSFTCHSGPQRKGRRLDSEYCSGGKRTFSLPF